MSRVVARVRFSTVTSPKATNIIHALDLKFMAGNSIRLIRHIWAKQLLSLLLHLASEAHVEKLCM